MMSSTGECWLTRGAAVYAHQQQSDNHGDVADGVGCKAPAFADFRDQDSGDGGANDARAIEHRRVESDGVHQVFLADHVDQEGLASGDVEGVDHAEQSGKDKDVRDLDAVGQGEPGEDSGEDHGSDLGGDDEALAIDAVGGDASKGSDEKDRNLAGEAYATEQQRGSREAVDEPCLGYGLHPGANEGDELSAEEELEISMAQGAQSGGPLREGSGFGIPFFSDKGVLFVCRHASRTFSHPENDGNPLGLVGRTGGNRSRHCFIADVFTWKADFHRLAGVTFLELPGGLVPR